MCILHVKRINHRISETKSWAWDYQLRNINQYFPERWQDNALLRSSLSYFTWQHMVEQSDIIKTGRTFSLTFNWLVPIKTTMDEGIRYMVGRGAFNYWNIPQNRNLNWDSRLICRAVASWAEDMSRKLISKCLQGFNLFCIITRDQSELVCFFKM